jgi:hypothetical protein
VVESFILVRILQQVDAVEKVVVGIMDSGNGGLVF